MRKFRSVYSVKSGLTSTHPGAAKLQCSYAEDCEVATEASVAMARERGRVRAACLGQLAGGRAFAAERAHVPGRSTEHGTALAPPAELSAEALLVKVLISRGQTLPTL
jgi:hypothetical protein